MVKAAGVSGIVAEMLKASGEAGLELFIELFNNIVKEEKVTSDWEMSVIINCFKGKGNAVEHGNFRGLKLLDHLMKVFERVIENTSGKQSTSMTCSLGSCLEKERWMQYLSLV